MSIFTDYIDAGLSVIPIRADGSKAPAIPWKSFCEHLVEQDEAASWAKKYNGVGIVCGAVSGNLEVIDIDEPSLTRPFVAAVAKADPALLVRLCLVETPRQNESGQHGLHIYYRCEEAVTGNLKLALSEPEGTPPKPRTLIETRGEGGYVLAPGCVPECHPTGQTYRHIDGQPMDLLSVLTAAERKTLHTIARMFDRSIAAMECEPFPAFPGKSNQDLPGTIYNQRATWPEILEPHGWVCIGEYNGLRQWRRPGKSTGISGTTGCLSARGNELFVVFSTNAHPFEGVNQSGRPGVPYSKFAAFTMLNHGGDFQAASRKLAELGCGTPAPKPERKNRVNRLTCEQAEIQYLDALAAGKMQLVSTGIEPLDHALGGGMERGEVLVLGGLPSHGKTVCGLQSLRVNAEAGRHGVLVSHEMGHMAIAKRMITTATVLESDQWIDRDSELRDERRQYWASCGTLFIMEQCREIDRIEREVSEIAKEFDLGVIVIDHAQLTYGKGPTRYEQLTHASGRFKEMAVRHNAVVVVLSQLSRESIKAGAESHHLKESGALEQDADAIAIVRWPWKADPDKHQNDPGGYEIKVTKNRNRPIVEWLVKCAFNPARQTIGAKRYPTHDAFDPFK